MHLQPCVDYLSGDVVDVHLLEPLLSSVSSVSSVVIPCSCNSRMSSVVRYRHRTIPTGPIARVPTRSPRGHIKWRNLARGSNVVARRWRKIDDGHRGVIKTGRPERWLTDLVTLREAIMRLTSLSPEQLVEPTRSFDVQVSG